MSIYKDSILLENNNIIIKLACHKYQYNPKSKPPLGLDHQLYKLKPVKIMKTNRKIHLAKYGTNTVNLTSKLQQVKSFLIKIQANIYNFQTTYIHQLVRVNMFCNQKKITNKKRLLILENRRLIIW